MIDFFVLLTPIIMIVVVSLVVFVGCDVAFGLKRVPIPFGLAAKTRSQRVDLTWIGINQAKKYKLWRHQGVAVPELLETVLHPQTFFVDTKDLVDGMEYLYQISMIDGDGDESGKSDPVNATPNPVNFIQMLTLTTARNNFTGFVGMGLQVGADDLDIVEIGRPFGVGNMQTHKIKIIDAAAANAELGSVMVDTTKPPRSVGQFQYLPLAQKVTLAAGGTYYILSEETSGGDDFYRHDATVGLATNVATVLGAYFEQPPGTFTQDMQAPMIYPVDFKY
ncbi:MAG: hypothetical protein ABI556_12855 [Gemmatimonadales bacterium]